MVPLFVTVLPRSGRTVSVCCKFVQSRLLIVGECESRAVGSRMGKGLAGSHTVATRVVGVVRALRVPPGLAFGSFSSTCLRNAAVTRLSVLFLCPGLGKEWDA